MTTHEQALINILELIGEATQVELNKLEMLRLIRDIRVIAADVMKNSQKKYRSASRSGSPQSLDGSGDNSMTNTLKPCPFCGGAALFRKALWPSGGHTDAILCANRCGMTTFDTGTTDESVINSWNARFQDYEFETPYTYAHVYPVPFGDRSVVHFETNGREINGAKPTEAIPLYIRPSHTRTPDPLVAELVEALDGYLDICPAFRSKPMGAPGSNARHNQTMHIGLEDRVKTLLSRVKEGK